MMRYIFWIVFIHCGVFQAWGQSHQVFEFPKGYASKNYHPQAIIYKLKSSHIPKSQDKIALPDAYLSKSLRASLRANSSRPLFAPDSYVFTDRNSEQIPTKIKQLSLIHILEIGEGQDLEKAINLVRQDPAVLYAEPLYRHYPLDVPNDPLAQPTTTQYHLDMIRAYEAWDIEQGDTSIVVGVVDNGFKVTYADLAANLQSPVIKDNLNDLKNDLAGASFNDQLDSDDDVEVAIEVTPGTLHGTAVALCSSAVPDNNLGTAGTGYHTKFLPVKVAPDDQLGIYISGYEGIVYAAKQDCHVINLSWGRTGLPSLAEKDILESIFYGQDAVIVAAAGNDNTKDFFYPASYDDIVLSVASLNSSQEKANTSTYNVKVDICAPGDQIIVAPDAPTASGTSFAAPLVAGAVAIVRSHYPSLNATQVVARIKSTTQDIYSNTANERYRGYLGTGLLDMHRSLADPFIAVNLDTFNFENGERGGFMYAGKSSNLTCALQNHLGALTNLQVTLRTESPYVEILDSSAIYGTVAFNTLANNTNDPFQVKIADHTPANTVALFELIYKDGSYTYAEEWPVLLNPGHMDINNINFTVSDQGRLAIYNNDFDELAGLTGVQGLVLREAGLMLALNENQLSDAVRNSGNSINQDFSISQPLKQFYNSEEQFLQTISSFEDISGNENRVGVQINQKTYAWSEPALENLVIVEYEIRNMSGQNLDSLAVAVLANWDINVSFENRANWDDERSLGFIYDPKNQGFYGGVRLLSPLEKRTHYAFENTSPIRFFDGFTDAEKFQTLTSGIANTEAGMTDEGKDVAHCVGGTLYDMGVGEVRKIAFAFILEENLFELLLSADAAQSRYRQLNLSPKPIISDRQICKGDDLLLQPQGGSTFEFYDAPPTDSLTTLLYRGNTLSIQDIISDQTYYVLNVDEIFKSDPVAVHIDVLNHQAEFSLAQDTIDFSVSPQLQLVSTSGGSVTWNWQITREGGNPNEDIQFLAGTNAQMSAPLISFNRTGKYSIKLLSQNSIACQSSLERELWVLRDISGLVTALEDLPQSKLEVFPNPATDILWVATYDFSASAQIILMDAQGRQVWKKANVFTNDEPLAISLADFPSGLYYLQIIEKNQVFTRKILLE